MPGEYEARTGIPFTGQIELRGSSCAKKCVNYESCFIAGRKPDGPFSYTPNRSCEFNDSVDIPTEQLIQRLGRRTTDLHTAGALLDTLLVRAGLRRHITTVLRALMKKNEMQVPDTSHESNVFITNAVRCRAVKTNEDGSVENATPDKQHIDTCRPWLKITEALVKPGIKVALGRPGLEALEMSSDGITKRAGKMEVAPNGDEIFIGLHPAYIMRKTQGERPGLEKDLIQLLTDAREYAEGKKK